ncbi:MAG TPA: Hsp20/alpha crystallin family protein [Longimicrobiaceae bacterium]|nr:Hsp20/alpha crystallin family protein [Longimicrobiaceae bacterium]
MAISPAYNRTPADSFDRLFDTLWGGTQARGNANLMRAPETDVIETEREIRVITEMPGLTRDNIEIDVENNVLTLRGEKREERTEGEQQGKYHLAERRYGVFTRSFVLPRDVDAERIAASFQDGVLTVSIPKSEKARRRRIQIGGMQEGAEGTNGSRENGTGELAQAEQQNG